MIELMIFTTSAIFMLMKHPISISMMILVQTIFIALKIGTMIKSFWFSYILFLVMVGGMLVLFLYMTNVASNEKFNLSNKLMMIMIMMLPMMMLMNLLLQQPFNIIEQKINKMMINKLFNQPFNMIIMMLMIYLLITMIMTVKMTELSKGPLRMKN
uniref:NADH-ubiquinone oxidoreductase chain 6 n=1 Tax=Cassidinae sp. ACP-2018 TaxID=2480630 RepID=A0A3G5FNR7_9CUCU|nr:NADH dehydrogenase subunit 6 [Cassidinae sp. ACP-2018]